MDRKNQETAINKILNSRKYRHLNLPRELIMDLFHKTTSKDYENKETVKTVKTKLHNIIAPYLDTLDYDQAKDELIAAVDNDDKESMHRCYRRFLRAHDSTCERLRYFEEFFDYIFSKTGSDCCFLDLACGLNPFFLPIVTLPKNTNFIVYDIHEPRVELLDILFEKTGFPGQAVKQDILVQPPVLEVRAAFLFKEAHRIEKRESGASRKLIKALRTELVFLSLPTHSLRGNFDLTARMDRLVNLIIDGIATLEETRAFESEMIYTIKKLHG